MTDQPKTTPADPQEKCGEKKERSANLVDFKKGFDPRRNLKGRPPKKNTFCDILAKILASNIMEVKLITGKEEQVIKLETDKNFYYATGVKLVIEALKGGVPALVALMNRVDGTPPQSISLGAFGQFGDEFKQMSSRERWEFIERGNEMLAKYREEIGPGEIIDIPGETE